jgi:DNA-binding transcriptional regulator GbsR (MarR family)
VLDITDDQHRFIEDMGQHMVGWGVPRNTGRVYAYLLLRPGPAGLDAIASDLEIAKSGASVATRQLVQFGLARALGARGSRRVLFEALHNLEAIFGARNAQARDLMERFREGAAVAPPGPRRQQLEEMVSTLDELLAVVPGVLRQIRERRGR